MHGSAKTRLAVMYLQFVNLALWQEESIANADKHTLLQTSRHTLKCMP